MTFIQSCIGCDNKLNSSLLLLAAGGKFLAFKKCVNTFSFNFQEHLSNLMSKLYHENADTMNPQFFLGFLNMLRILYFFQNLSDVENSIFFFQNFSGSEILDFFLEFFRHQNLEFQIFSRKKNVWLKLPFIRNHICSRTYCKSGITAPHRPFVEHCFYAPGNLW